jgi:hypothetical protein
LPTRTTTSRSSTARACARDHAPAASGCGFDRPGEREEWHERDALLAALAQQLVVDATEVDAVPVLHAYDRRDLLGLREQVWSDVGDAEVADQAGVA